jgi:hypothetical protein
MLVRGRVQRLAAASTPVDWLPLSSSPRASGQLWVPDVSSDDASGPALEFAAVVGVAAAEGEQQSAWAAADSARVESERNALDEISSRRCKQLEFECERVDSFWPQC